MRFLSSGLLAYVLGSFLSTEWKLFVCRCWFEATTKKKKNQKEIILGKLNKGPQTVLTLCVKFYFKILWPGGPLLDHLTNHWKQRVPVKTTNHNYAIMFERAFPLLKPSKVMFDTWTLLYGVFPGLLGQGISVTYQRRTARRRKLARTTWPETHRPRVIMKPKD